MLDTHAPFHVPVTGARIELRRLAKRFDAAPVLAELDLAIAPGEFLSIVGKSGCGKSTLLRVMTGLDTPSAGQVLIDGRPPAEAGASVRMMFQEPRLLPWASVAQNVALGLPQGAGAPDAVREVLQAVQLDGKADVWPASLSGGQRQRVALARALVSRPHLLAFDEPLGALDALTRIVMQDLILRVKAEVGFTAVLVTHDVAEAVALSDRIIVLDGGRVIHEERVDEPHPRARASAAHAAIEARILSVILGR